MKSLDWLAGLVEGEGSFCITQRAKNRLQSPKFKIKMTDEDVIMWARERLAYHGIPLNIYIQAAGTHKLYIVGEGVVSRPRKTSFEIATTKQDYVEIIISLLYPYFGEKKKADCDRVMELIRQKRKTRDNK